MYTFYMFGQRKIIQLQSGREQKKDKQNKLNQGGTGNFI